jgi:DnaJ-class molecular chaperone
MSENGIERKGDGHYLTRYIDVCRNCKGSGKVANLCRCTPQEAVVTCPVCVGSGRVIVVKDIIITVEPYNSQTT